MSRLSDAILQNNTAFAQNRQNPLLDLRYGGQNGFAPDYTQWISNQSYVQRNLFCLLIESPTGFQKLPSPDYWVATLKSLVELHALSWTGFNSGLTVDVVDGSPVGGAGELQQEFTDVKRARSTPVLRLNEKYGRPCNAFLDGWITHLMMDPASKIAGVATLGTAPADMLADVYSATMLFIEPDPTHTRVVKSWLCTNMWPHMTGDVIGRRELTSAGELVNLDITFSAITQYGLGVDKFAQQLLSSINITGANPNNRPAFVDAITADVTAVAQGYKAGAEELGSTSIKV